MPPQQIFDANIAAQERIQHAAREHPNDFRAQCRAAEVTFWNDWYRSGSSGDTRDGRYAAAAFACADAFHVREKRPVS